MTDVKHLQTGIDNTEFYSFIKVFLLLIFTSPLSFRIAVRTSNGNVMSFQVRMEKGRAMAGY